MEILSAAIVIASFILIFIFAIKKIKSKKSVKSNLPKGGGGGAGVWAPENIGQPETPIVTGKPDEPNHK
jgi:hypothetical protein